MLRGISRLYLSVVLLLTLFGAYYIGFSILASMKERDVNAAWEKTLGGSFDPVAKFPKTTKNATTQMIEDMTDPDKGQFGLKRPILQPAWPGGSYSACCLQAFVDHRKTGSRTDAFGRFKAVRGRAGRRSRAAGRTTDSRDTAGTCYRDVVCGNRSVGLVLR